MVDKVTIKNEFGQKKVCSILSVFNIEGKPEEYAIFTDYSKDEFRRLNIFSGVLNPDGTVAPIRDEEAVKVVNSFIDKLFNK